MDAIVEAASVEVFVAHAHGSIALCCCGGGGNERGGGDLLWWVGGGCVGGYEPFSFLFGTACAINLGDGQIEIAS